MILGLEVARRNRFKMGTPVVYFDGKREITGEVIKAENGKLAISSYEKTKGIEKNIYIPKTWFDVCKFSEYKR